MKLHINKIAFAIVCLFTIGTISCNKELDEKSNKALAVPSTVADYQALLDNAATMNEKSATWDEISADNYYLPEATFNGEELTARNAYLWKNEIYNGPFNDWSYLYDAVYYANLSLEGMDKIQRTNSNTAGWNNVKGSALFFRAQSFLHAVFIFCKAYDSSTADKDYGIALRLSSDFNLPSVRASLKDSYAQIISDLIAAIPLLPVTPVTPYRPSKPAAYALLARAYMSMRDYTDAGKYADSCLQLKSDLTDYNTLAATSLNPFMPSENEIIFQRYAVTYNFLLPLELRVDTLLYASYEANDLRKQVFFYPLAPGYIFKGEYSGSLSYMFTGIATDEIYLTRAECYARAGKIQQAMNDLNKLMETRWQTGTFMPFAAENASDALKLILSERRKELVFRCLRWADIKRLNKEGANITLERIVNGQTYTLPSNDNKYALPLPADIVNISGMLQNPE